MIAGCTTQCDVNAERRMYTLHTKPIRIRVGFCMHQKRSTQMENRKVGISLCFVYFHLFSFSTRFVYDVGYYFDGLCALMCARWIRMYYIYYVCVSVCECVTKESCHAFVSRAKPALYVHNSSRLTNDAENNFIAVTAAATAGAVFVVMLLHITPILCLSYIYKLEHNFGWSKIEFFRLHRLRWWHCLCIFRDARNSVVFHISFEFHSATTKNSDRNVVERWAYFESMRCLFCTHSSTQLIGACEIKRYFTLHKYIHQTSQAAVSVLLSLGST